MALDFRHAAAHQQRPPEKVRHVFIFYCTIVLLYYCTIVLLHQCIIVLLHCCIIICGSYRKPRNLWYCDIVALHYLYYCFLPWLATACIFAAMAS